MLFGFQIVLLGLTFFTLAYRVRKTFNSSSPPNFCFGTFLTNKAEICVIFHVIWSKIQWYLDFYGKYGTFLSPSLTICHKTSKFMLNWENSGVNSCQPSSLSEPSSGTWFLGSLCFFYSGQIIKVCQTMYPCKACTRLNWAWHSSVPAWCVLVHCLSRQANSYNN